MSGDCKLCSNNSLPTDAPVCVRCGIARKSYTPMTNYQWLRSMPVKGLAAWLAGTVDNAPNSEYAKSVWLEWLNAPMDEEEQT